MKTTNKNTKWNALFLASLISVSTATGQNKAETAFRLGPNSWEYFLNASSSSYQTCYDDLDYMHFDGRVNGPVYGQKIEQFRTNKAMIEIPNESPGGYTGQRVVNRIAEYETAGFDVTYVFLYREDWLKEAIGSRFGGPGGPYAVDRRILSSQEINNVRNAIANSSLDCKHTVKLIQLLGGRVPGEQDPALGHANGDSWLDMSGAHKAHIAANFDGVGTECHVGDHQATQLHPDGPRTLEAMAKIAKWARNNSKKAFVFMGGSGGTYTNLGQCQSTYWNLWTKMSAQGVSKNEGHIIYFRQGAWDGNNSSSFLPENNNNTLTRQIKWVINAVK